MAHEPCFDRSPPSELKSYLRKRDLRSLIPSQKPSATSSIDTITEPHYHVKSLSRIRSGRTGVKQNVLTVHDVLLKRILTNGQWVAPPGDQSLFSEANLKPSKLNLPHRNGLKLAAVKRNLRKGLSIL